MESEALEKPLLLNPGYIWLHNCLRLYFTVLMVKTVFPIAYVWVVMMVYTYSFYTMDRQDFYLLILLGK